MAAEPVVRINLAWLGGSGMGTLIIRGFTADAVLGSPNRQTAKWGTGIVLFLGTLAMFSIGLFSCVAVLFFRRT